MGFILWPAVPDAASENPTAERVKSCCNSCCRGWERWQRFVQLLPIFSLLFSHRIFVGFFVAALCTNRGQRSRSCLPVRSGFCLAKPLANKKGLVWGPFGVLEILWASTRFHLPTLHLEAGGGTLVLVRCSHLWFGERLLAEVLFGFSYVNLLVGYIANIRLPVQDKKLKTIFFT